MQLKILHRTEYLYDSPARESVNEIKLTPRDTSFQTCQHTFISTFPPASPRPYVDLYGNCSHYLEIPERHDRLVIEARMRIQTNSPPDLKKLPYGVPMSALAQVKDREDCHPFLQTSSYVEISMPIWREAIDIMGKSRDVFQTGYAIMAHIFENFKYRPGTTRVTTHATEVINKRQGVCQDYAHAMTAYCRSLNIPARYVSGYFFDSTRDQTLRGSEATHAWVEIFVDGHGWIGLDPTNNKVIDDTYIVLAVGRDYADVAPISGRYYGGGTSLLSVHVTVRRFV